MRSDEKPDDFFEDIEIFDLPEEDAPDAPTKRRSHDSMIEGLWHRRRRPINITLMVSTILLAFVLLYSAGGSTLLAKFIGGHFQGQTKITSAKQTPTLSDSDARVMMQLRQTPPGPVPDSCPRGPAVHAGQSIEQAPLKIIGFSGPTAQLHLHVLKTIKSPQGSLTAWGTRLMISIEAQDIPSVWLQFSSSNGENDPIFGLEAGRQPASLVSATNGAEAGNVSPSPSTIFLSPHMPTLNNGEATPVGPNTWQTSVYFSDAGCYSLTAGWPTGHWQINFASGA